MAAPQKKPLGNGMPEEESKGVAWELERAAEPAARAAFEDMLQPENRLAGSAAAMPAAKAECVNARRVRCKVEYGSFTK